MFNIKCNEDGLVVEIKLLQKHEAISKQIEVNLGAKMPCISQWIKH